jgi:hypothetical protein
LTPANVLLVSYSFAFEPPINYSAEDFRVRICPECETVYEEPGIEICPNCDVPLMDKVEEPDAAPAEDDSNLPSDGLIVIESTDDEDRIGLLRELLEDGGIPCFLSDELFTEEPIPAEKMVMIPREMESDARKLIRDYFS